MHLSLLISLVLLLVVLLPSVSACEIDRTITVKLDEVVNQVIHTYSMATRSLISVVSFPHGFSYNKETGGVQVTDFLTGNQFVLRFTCTQSGTVHSFSLTVRREIIRTTTTAAIPTTRTAPISTMGAPTTSVSTIPTEATTATTASFSKSSTQISSTIGSSTSTRGRSPPTAAPTSDVVTTTESGQGMSAPPPAGANITIIVIAVVVGAFVIMCVIVLLRYVMKIRVVDSNGGESVEGDIELGNRPQHGQEEEPYDVPEVVDDDESIYDTPNDSISSAEEEPRDGDREPVI